MKYSPSLPDSFRKLVSTKNSSNNFLVKLIILVIFSFCLFIFKFPLWKEISLFIFISNIQWFKNKTHFFTVFNIFLWILAGSFVLSEFGPTSIMVFDWESSLLGFSPNFSYPTQISYLIIAVCFFGIYSSLFCILRKFRINQPVWISFAVLLVLLSLFYLYKAISPFNWILFGIILAFSKSFWMMMYQFSEYDFLKKYSLYQHFSTISPPWQQGWAKYSVLRGFSDYLNNKLDSEVEIIENQISAVILIFWALILKFISKYLYLFIFKNVEFDGQSLSLSEFLGFTFSLDNLFAGAIPIRWSWFFILSVCFLLLINLASATHAVVAVARMFGYFVEKNFNSPYRATSFNNFLSRIYHYYIAILLRVFYYPLWSQLRIIKHKKTRIFFVSFLTILLGGLIDSVVNRMNQYLIGAPQDVLSTILSRSPYFILLALFSGVSALITSRGMKSRTWPMQALMVSFYFLLYSISYFFQLGAGTFTIEQKCSTISRILTFGIL